MDTTSRSAEKKEQRWKTRRLVPDLAFRPKGRNFGRTYLLGSSALSNPPKVEEDHTLQQFLGIVNVGNLVINSQPSNVHYQILYNWIPCKLQICKLAGWPGWDCHSNIVGEGLSNFFGLRLISGKWGQPSPPPHPPTLPPLALFDTAYFKKMNILFE